MYGGGSYGKLAYGAEGTIYTQAVTLTGIAIGSFEGGFGQVSTRAKLSWARITMPSTSLLAVGLTGVSFGTAIGQLTGNAPQRGFLSWAKLALPTAQAGVLTGVSASFSLGSMSVFSGLSATPAGRLITSAVGTPSASINVTLTGQQITSAVGTLFAGDVNLFLINPPTPQISIGLTGFAMGTAVGSLGASGANGTAVQLTGLSMSTAVGALTSPSQSISVALSGLSIGTTIGVIAPQTTGGLLSVTLTGQLVGTQYGTLSPHLSVNLLYVVDPVYQVYVPERIWTVMVPPE